MEKSLNDFVPGSVRRIAPSHNSTFDKGRMNVVGAVCAAGPFTLSRTLPLTPHIILPTDPCSYSRQKCELFYKGGLDIALFILG